MTSHKLSLLDALRKILTSRSKPAEQARMQRSGTVLRPSAALPASSAAENGSAIASKPPAEPSETPATARKPDASSGESNMRQDMRDAWTTKGCPVHETGDLIEGRYEVRERFEGAMGYVYIARDTTQDLTFAIKQPKEQMLANRDFFARVLREADAWTGLGMHPHIAYCYFVKSLEGVPHIFVEYVDGGNLRDWISEGRCPDERARLELAIQFCHGMEHAHGRGMIHRDIKPENILLSSEGTVKVTDFGLVGEAAGRTVAASTHGEATGTRFGDLMGTPAYMAPEQLADPRQRSTEVPDGVWTDSDVYSFGICLWELFCGGRPDQFESTGAAAIHRARPDLPAGLGELLLATVAKDRAQRPPDFTALRERLNGIYRELFREDARSYRIEVPETAADELNNQGYSYFELGKPEEARACFERAREIEPAHPQATYNLSLLQWRAGEIDDLEVLRRMENCKRNPTVNRQMLAELTAYIHAERFAPDLAREVLKEYPGQYEALFAGMNMGEIRRVSNLVEGRWPAMLAAVAMSHDGRRALCGRENNSSTKHDTYELWDLETGTCLRKLEGHSQTVDSVAMTHDGHLGLSSNFFYNPKTKVVSYSLQLSDLETGTCLRTLEEHTTFVRAVALTPDGRRGLSGSDDKTLRLWDLETGACLRTLAGHTGVVKSVALTPDGRRGLSGSDDNTLRLWDLETGECLHTLGGHTKGITAVSMTTDGRQGLSSSDDYTIRIWNLETGDCMNTLSGHLGSVSTIAMTADGQRGLSGSHDKTLRLWNLKTGACLRTLEGDTKLGVKAVALSPDGHRALSGGYDGILRLWDLEGKTGVSAPLYLAHVRAYAECREREAALRAGLVHARESLEQNALREAHERLMRTWEAVDFRVEPEIEELHGRLFARGLLGAPREVIRLHTLKGHTHQVGSASLTPDGRRGLSASYDNTLRLWDLDTGTCLRTLEGHTTWVMDAAMTPDGRRGLSAGKNDYTLRLWDLETGACLRTMKSHHDGQVVAITPDGRRGLSGGWHPTLRCSILQLWDLETGTCLRTLVEHTSAFSAVVITPDSRRGLSGSSGDNTLGLWDLDTGTCLRTLEGHTDPVYAAALTPDGRRGLSGSWDNTLRLWDLETGACLRTLTDHSKTVTAVAITPDGRHGLSGSQDKTIRLWNLETGACLRTLTDHSNTVSALAITPDGRRGLSASLDRTLMVWRFVWELEFPDPADWDEGARPYLQTFLTLHCPVAEDVVSRINKPRWGDDNFQKLIEDLQLGGYGWLRPEGVRRELEAMTVAWEGPPPLVGQAP